MWLESLCSSPGTVTTLFEITAYTIQDKKFKRKVHVLVHSEDAYINSKSLSMEVKSVRENKVYINTYMLESGKNGTVRPCRVRELEGKGSERMRLFSGTDALIRRRGSSQMSELLH